MKRMLQSHLPAQIWSMLRTRICPSERASLLGMYTLTFLIDDDVLILQFSPGRWLASHVIKLTVAYLLYNYELKLYSQWPLNIIIFGTNMLDRQVTMMVRRRKH